MLIKKMEGCLNQKGLLGFFIILYLTAILKIRLMLSISGMIVSRISYWKFKTIGQ